MTPVAPIQVGGMATRMGDGMAACMIGGMAARMAGGGKPFPELGGDQPLVEVGSAPTLLRSRFGHTIGLRHVAFRAGKWDPLLNVNTPGDPAPARQLAPWADEGER